MAQMKHGEKYDKRLFFGIVGLSADSDEIRINDDLIFRKVAGIKELQLDPPKTMSPLLASALVLWPPHITHEIEMNVEIVKDEYENAMGYCTTLATLLRVSSDIEFMIPLYSDISWKTLKDVDVSTVKVGQISFEQTNDPIMVGDKFNKITMKNLQWVDENYKPFGDLFNATSDKERFVDIFNSISLHHLESSPSMALLRLIIPFDMLFGEFRSGSGLAMLTSAYLFEYGESRFHAYNEISNCYSIRNKIIHGHENKPTDEEIRSAIQTMRHHLGGVLKKVIKEGKFPTKGKLRSLLLRG